jgi:hypothetical protein
MTSSLFEHVLSENRFQLFRIMLQWGRPLAGPIHSQRCSNFERLEPRPGVTTQTSDRGPAFAGTAQV